MAEACEASAESSAGVVTLIDTVQFAKKVVRNENAKKTYLSRLNALKLLCKDPIHDNTDVLCPPNNCFLCHYYLG